MLRLRFRIGLLAVALVSTPAGGEERCVHPSFTKPLGEVCVVTTSPGPGKGQGENVSLRMKAEGRAGTIETTLLLAEGERLELGRIGALGQAAEVLVWLPIVHGSEGHTLVFVYRLRPGRWKQLPARLTCQRRCTLQHVSYQTTLKPGPSNASVFYETVTNGQHLKSTYSWDGKQLLPVEIEEPKASDALSRGSTPPPVLPVCERTAQVSSAIVGFLGTPCEQVLPGDLDRITRLDFSGKNIRALKPGDFSGLQELTSLDLMDNPLEDLPAGLFDGLFKLRSLNFQGCRLRTVPGGVFSHLGSLKDLYLNHNRLTELPADAFTGLSSLGFLPLNNNQLRSLPPDLFKPLPKSCHIYLSDNPLSSD